MKFLLILSVLFLASCAGTTGRTFNELQKGMSQESSMLKLGKADAVIQKDGMEMHKYTNLYGPKKSHNGCNSCSKSIGKCDYYVVYCDGRLIEYGQVDARPKSQQGPTNVFFEN